MNSCVFVVFGVRYTRTRSMYNVKEFQNTAKAEKKAEKIERSKTKFHVARVACTFPFLRFYISKYSQVGEMDATS